MRLHVPAQVRRFDRWGYIVDDSTLFATIEWETGEFEEVDQFDNTVEVVDSRDPAEAVADLTEELEELEEKEEEDLTPEESAEIELLEDEISELEVEAERQVEREARYARHQAEEGHRARSAQSASIGGAGCRVMCEYETLKVAGAYDGPPPPLPECPAAPSLLSKVEVAHECEWSPGGEPLNLTAAIADAIEWMPRLYARMQTRGSYGEARKLAGAIRNLAAYGCSATREQFGRFGLPPEQEPAA